MYALAARALELACFRCGPRVRTQINGLPLGQHLSAVLSSLMVVHFEVRRIPAYACACPCGRVHSAEVIRWRDDTFIQRVANAVSAAAWRGQLGTIYPQSLELEWSAGTGTAQGVVWTDLLVDVAAGRLRV
eukprot:gene17671-biopygen20394